MQKSMSHKYEPSSEPQTPTPNLEEIDEAVARTEFEDEPEVIRGLEPLVEVHRVRRVQPVQEPHLQRERLLY